MPMARARNTATIETMWYRKSTTLEVLSKPEDQAVPACVQDADVGLAGRRDGRRNDQRDQRRGDQQQQSAARDARAVQPAHALGINELAADAQPSEKCASHAGAALVEELDQRGVRADGNEKA